MLRVTDQAFGVEADPFVAKDGIQFFPDGRGRYQGAAMMFGILPGITLRIEDSLAYTNLHKLQELQLFYSVPFHSWAKKTMSFLISASPLTLYS